jgi:hypothetical protein
MRRSKRVDGPLSIVLMGYEGANAEDLVVDVFGKLVAHRGANFVIASAVMTIGSGEALETGNRFDIPDDDAGHVTIKQVGCLKVHC